MQARFEKVLPATAGFHAFERVDAEFAFNWHYHPEYELTFIVDSHGQRLVGDNISEYGPGDVVLLGPDLPHTWRSVPSHACGARMHRAVVIHFRRDFPGGDFFHLKEMAPVLDLLNRCSTGLAYGHTSAGADVARRMMGLPARSGSRQLLELLSIMVDLAAEPNAVPLSTGRVSPRRRVGDQQRVDAICTHLHECLGEDIDFTGLARLVHMDQASLCRFFKRATGRTITAYVNELRVAAAAQMLIETDLSILEVSLRAGFGNYSNFNRCFRRLKEVAPRTLRQQFRPGA